MKSIHFPTGTCAAYVLLAFVATINGAQAQQAKPSAPDMSSMSSGTTGGNAEIQAYKAANDKMMQDMNAPKTGDADQDFVASMIPHHQGAIDMANIELKYGKDAQLRKLAQNIVDAQKKEIATMKAWQAKHPK